VKLDQAVVEISRLGIDTSPLIYFVERHAGYVDIMRKILSLVDSGQFTGYSSVITLTEVLVLPKRAKNIDLENKYRDLLLHSRNYQITPIDSTVAELAASLRAQHNLRTPDALQVASAIQSGCQAFLTNDKSIKRLQDIQILILDELEQ
jgi:predicted nucleic acid-binding protein